MKAKVRRFLDFTLDEKADVIAPWTFFIGSSAIAVFLSLFQGIMLLLYLAIFVSAGILTLCLFFLSVTKYRDKKYQIETKKAEKFQDSLDFVKKHGADDLDDEQISILVRRTRS